jgi:pimeloyl-ACP methyl ester carboxylesterase
MAVASRIRVAGGVSLTDAGQGRPALLLHGIGGSARSLGAVSSILADQGMRALAWDAPGYGESTDPADPQSLDYPARVVQILDDLEVERVDLVGTSWGGVIAALVAARHPTRVRTLVLADSTRGAGTSGERATAMRARVTELNEQGAERFAAIRARRLIAPGCDPAVAEAVRTEMSRVRLAGYGAAAEYMATTDTAHVLARLDVPTLVLVGEHDKVTGVAESRLLADTVPGARFVLIPGAGHAAVTERPAEVAAALLQFWRTT